MVYLQRACKTCAWIIPPMQLRSAHIYILSVLHFPRNPTFRSTSLPVLSIQVLHSSRELLFSEMSSISNSPIHELHKRRYSCFFGTDFEILMKGLRAYTLIMIGGLTDVCVHYSFVASARLLFTASLRIVQQGQVRKRTKRHCGRWNIYKRGHVELRKRSSPPL